jgi:transposase
MSTSPYSQDLRTKVINYLNQGNSQQQASQTFSIHKNTINRWWVRYQEEGNYTARKRLGRKSKLELGDIENFVKNILISTLSKLVKNLVLQPDMLVGY